MKWSEFKRKAQEAGVTEDSDINYISVGTGVNGKPLFSWG